MILEGQLPGRFVYRDEVCAAFLTIEPLSPGHTLVVPNAEVEHWIDLDPALAAHLMDVAQKVGVAINDVYLCLLVLYFHHFRFSFTYLVFAWWELAPQLLSLSDWI